jgi:peptidyl-prolyl cis-trans isomerase A (cyclophilin A)
MRLTALAFLLLAAPAFAQAPEAAPPADPVVTAAPPALTNPPMTGPRLLISTAMGDITLQLDSAHAPKSVADILKFVKAKHYDGTVVYRVAKGFVIQMGSWEAHMKGRGYHPVPVPLEADNGLHNLRGTVALARADAPDSAGPEFFISLVDNVGQLDHKAEDTGNTSGYAVFGQVTSGMDVVDAIGDVAVGDDGPIPGQAPVDPILIKKIAVLK